MKNTPKTMIKCKFSNEVHKVLEPNFNLKRTDRIKRYNKSNLTNEEKAKLFDKILDIHAECSHEIAKYQYDKRSKKRIHKARVERGYNFKKKTKKEDYLNSLIKVA